MNSTRSIACITGASAGIGAEFARQLAARGYDLILVARRLDRLQALAAELRTVQCECVRADVGVASDRAALAERLRNEPRLELLVNNAGFGTKGRFWEADFERQREMHEVHVMATMELTHAALANMVPRNRGAVIQVASVASFAQSQGSVGYCATKTWMRVFSEALAMELRGVGSAVQVQALCPGFTYSEFHDVVGVSRDRIPKWLWMQAGVVVRASLDALQRREIVVVPGWMYKVAAAVLPRLPLRMRLALQAGSPHTRGRL